MKVWLVALVGTVAVTAVGCKKDGEGTVGAGSGSSAALSSAAVAAAAPKVKANPTVLDHLKKISEGCTVRVDSAQTYGCKNKEEDAFKDWIAANKPTDVYETFASVIAGTDEKATAVAIAQADDVWSRMDKDLRKSNATPGASAIFLDALAKDDHFATRLARATTYLATLSGQRARLYTVTDGLKTATARQMSYRSMMTYGRLDVLPKLQEVAKLPDYTIAALAAPREMYEWKPEENAAICPWAKGFLGDAKLEIAAEAGYDMVSCKGEFVDTLLDEGEKRLKDKSFKTPFSSVFREVCFEFMKGVTGQSGRDAQCARNYAFLEKVANDPTVDSKVRGTSLWNIYYQRRDQQTLDLMRKYQNDKDPEVAKQAKDAIKSLTTAYKLK